MARASQWAKAEPSAEVFDACHEPLQGLRPSRAFYRDFGLCRMCLRLLALRGELPGVTKASW